MTDLSISDILKLARELRKLGVEEFEGLGCRLHIRHVEPVKRKRKPPPDMMVDEERDDPTTGMGGPYEELGRVLWPKGIPRKIGSDTDGGG